jgi:hypothetical protein
MVEGLTCSYREDDPLRHPGCAVGDWLDIVGCKDDLAKSGQASSAAEQSRLIRGQARTQRPGQSKCKSLTDGLSSTVRGWPHWYTVLVTHPEESRVLAH